MWAPAALALAFTSLFLSVSAGSVSAHFVPNVMPTPPRAGGGSTASAGSASAPTDSEPDTLPGARVGGSAHPTEQALIGCSEPFCGGTCTFVALPSVAKNVCTKANAPFASGMVWSPDGSAVQFGVFAGTSDCGQSTQLEAVNICYNLLNNGSPASFSNFFTA